MRIAVNAGSFSKNNFDFFLKFASTHPEEIFLFFFNKEPSSVIFPSNVKAVSIPSKTAFGLNRNAWYSFKIKKALKKEKVDIFISEKSILLKTKIPQILLSPELSFLFYPAGLNKKAVHFYKKNNPLFFNKAAQIILNSFFLKKEIMERFEIPEEKIRVIYPESKNDFKAPSYEERESFKEKYANANEYFVYKGSIGANENLLNLLKAFSFFKKRQRSKMQLILVGTRGVEYEEFLESVRLFRFKEEVKILTDILPDEAEKIVSYAYAMVYVPLFKSDPAEVVEAMRCEVPLVVSSTAILKEYCGEAALFAEAADFKNIAEQIMFLFKNEQKRKELIEKGKSELQKFTGNNLQVFLWEMIKKLQEKKAE